MKTTIEKRTGDKLPKWLSILLGFVIAFILIVCAIYISFNVVYDYYPINGDSMYPTINGNGFNEDGVYVNLFSKGEVGDIIVVKDPTENRKINVIKRLIGTGGDKVAIKYDPLLDEWYLSVIRKGTTLPVRLDEPYLTERCRKIGMENCYVRFYGNNLKNKTFDDDYLVIPEGHIFFLGDNREVSLDCSDYGPVLEDHILGKAEILIKGRTNKLGQILGFFWQQFSEFFS